MDPAMVAEGSRGPATRMRKAISECQICSDSLTDPVATSCGHVFCWPCLSPWLELSSTKPCPSCRTPLITVENILPLRVSAGDEAAEVPAAPHIIADDRPPHPRPSLPWMFEPSEEELQADHVALFQALGELAREEAGGRNLATVRNMYLEEFSASKEDFSRQNFSKAQERAARRLHMERLQRDIAQSKRQIAQRRLCIVLD